MSNEGTQGGCSSCGQPDSPAKFKISISLGKANLSASAISGEAWASIVYDGDLAAPDMLDPALFSVSGGLGQVVGSIDSGSVSVLDPFSGAPVASATSVIVMENDGIHVASITITIPAQEAGGPPTVHLFERSSSGAYEGISYTRTEDGEAETLAYYSTGVVDQGWGSPLAGNFKVLNLDGSLETWDAPPTAEGTFVWTTDASHVNGGYFAGVLTDVHELVPTDSSQPKVTTTRYYSKIGDENTNQLVLLNEEVTRNLGETTLSTEMTLYGYDEQLIWCVSTQNPDGKTNDRFGQRLWTVNPDGSWLLEVAQELPSVADYYIFNETTQEYDLVPVDEFDYGDVVQFTPWLDGPTPAAPLATQTAASTFFASLMAEARGNDFQIAGCRAVLTTPSDSASLNESPAWTERRTETIGALTLGVSYSYDYAYSTLYLGQSVGELTLNQRQERWNAGETAGTWTTSTSGSTNLSVSLDHTGIARLSSTDSLAGGGTANDSWQTLMNVSGSNYPPNYTAATDHPLWSTTEYDAQGRVVSETSKLRLGGTDTPIQTITTDYTGETAYTRTAGGLTLATQGEDTVAGGQRTSVSTDAQGVVTTTVTDDSTGELISETRVGTDAGLNVTTSYAKATNATTGETTQTVTQTADGITRTVSVTVTDAQGRTVSVTDANGGTTTYDYSVARTVTETLPGGGTRVTESYLDGQLKSITGTAVTPEYHHYAVNDDSDASYEAGSITETVYYGTDNGDAWRKMTTNYLGQVLREEAPSPTGTGVSVTTHTYNAKGQRVKTSSPGMADLIIAYDDWGQVSQQGYDMNADGELTASSTDVLSTSATDYVQAEGTVLERVVRQQYTKDNAADTLQTTTERQLLQGSTWQRTTQADGTVLTQSDAISGSTRTVTAQQSVTGTQVQTQVYVNGLLMSETLPGTTQAVTYDYNGFGQLWHVVHPLSGTTTCTYDPTTGNLLTQGQTGGDTVTYVTNARGLVDSVTHTDGTSTPYTSYTYDVQGRVLTQDGSADYPLRYEYDTLGRLWKLHTYRSGTLGGVESGDVTTWNYDPGSGVLLGKTDAASRTVGYTYDAAGRVYTRTWQRGGTTTYGYDGAGRRTSIDYSDAVTPDVGITYDRAGRRATLTDGAGAQVFTYDDDTGGQPDTWTVSGSGAWSGLSVGYGNTAGRRSSRDTSLGGIALPGVGYTYDPASGRMATVTAGGITATYRYNAGTGWNDGVDYSGGSGLSSTRTPDALGRLDPIAWSSGATTVSGHDYTINAMNRRTDALRQDGTAWSYGYNDRGEVTSAAKKDAGSVYEPGKKFAFEYDGIGNRTSSKVSSITDPDVLRTTGYTPNALNQYDEITHPQPGWLVLRGSVNAAAAAAGATVTVDGNAPTVTAGTLWFHEQEVDNSAGAVRRVVNIAAARTDGGAGNGPVNTQQKGAVYIPPPSEVPTYDEDGNLTGDARWNYTWDGENRLIVQEEKTGIIAQPAGATVVRKRLEFSYDSQGRRLTKSIYKATGTGGSFELQQSLLFLYDGWNMIAEIDTTTSATLLRSYEWGMDVSGTLDGAGGVGGLLLVRCHTAPSSGVYAPCYDGNGNVTELVNLADGSVSARYEYGAFGETISMDGGSVAAANPFRFSTKYLDVETGLYNYGYRYYDAVNGRWPNRDPMGEAGGVNLYGMCGNDAVNSSDVLGLRDFVDFAKNYKSVADKAIPYWGSRYYEAQVSQQKIKGMPAAPLMLMFYFRRNWGSALLGSRYSWNDVFDLTGSGSLKNLADDVNENVLKEDIERRVNDYTSIVGRTKSGDIGFHFSDEYHGLISNWALRLGIQHYQLSYEMSCDVPCAKAPLRRKAKCNGNFVLYDLYDFSPNTALEYPLGLLMGMAGKVGWGLEFHTFGSWQKKYEINLSR